MKNTTPPPLTVRFPDTEEEQRALARQVSALHADFVIAAIRKLNCPAWQKRELVQAVMDTVQGAHGQENAPGITKGVSL